MNAHVVTVDCATVSNYEISSANIIKFTVYIQLSDIAKRFFIVRATNLVPLMTWIMLDGVMRQLKTCPLQPKTQCAKNAGLSVSVDLLNIR